MTKQGISILLAGLKTEVIKRSPEILVGVGIAGMFTTTILAVKATPKALKCISDAKTEQNVDELKPTETVKAAWKCYIPAAATGALSAVCLIGANSIQNRRNAAIAAAYTLASSNLEDFIAKSTEVVGEKKTQEIKDAVAKERIDRDPVSSKEVIITGKGETLCYDYWNARYFKSDIDSIKKAINELNRRMRDEMYISLNEFYSEIGLEPCGSGDRLGWNIDNGYIEPEFSSQLTPEGTPCLVLSYLVEPRYDFCSLH